ncbi:MAG: hypothetical protein IKC65_03095 [Lentisphaeria bacterium]|nr:hypothetical protein [Lentisphaeria bacterium]
MFLEQIDSPAGIKQLSIAELEQLAEEIRQEIIRTVGKNGGHLASNLGCVELTLALHKQFDIPRDALIFDVGHQAYTHKLLTGRRANFGKLRKIDGISGFPFPEESQYDTGVSGHAGVAVSLAKGIASGRKKSDDDGLVIAVIGDGSLTCGCTFEGLNSGKHAAKKLIVILNDNQMSISRNVGGLSRCLNRVISGNFYNRLRNRLREMSRPRKRLYSFLTRIDDAVKSAFLPPGQLFQELGYRYLALSTDMISGNFFRFSNGSKHWRDLSSSTFSRKKAAAALLRKKIPLPTTGFPDLNHRPVCAPAPAAVFPKPSANPFSARRKKMTGSKPFPPL